MCNYATRIFKAGRIIEVVLFQRRDVIFLTP
jgi:hypothetical protein